MNASVLRRTCAAVAMQMASLMKRCAKPSPSGQGCRNIILLPVAGKYLYSYICCTVRLLIAFPPKR
eukprot:1717284-Karenia_brevis.AAC.1